MFVFLSKFLPLFVYPLGLACILLLFSLVWKRQSLWQRVAVLLALILLVLGSNPYVALGLARSLEWRYLPPAELPQADAIVILGGGTEPMLEPRSIVELNSAGDRMLYGFWLYKQGKAPHVLLSGGNITWLRDYPTTPAQDMATVLEMMGVSEDALWLQSKSQNTYEDALYSSQMLKEKGIQRVILVTSAMHMPRSVALFEKQGITVIPAPTDFKVTQARWQELFQSDVPALVINLMPAVDNLSLTSSALKEYIGLAVYRLQGWL